MEVNKGYKYGQTLKKVELRKMSSIIKASKEEYINRFVIESPLSTFLLNMDSNLGSFKYAKSFGDYSKGEAGQFNSDMSHREYVSSDEKIDLDSNSSKSFLSGVFKKRKSRRDFANKEWSFDELSSILSEFRVYSNGHRSYASAGNMYPISIYFYPLNIKGISSACVYKYQPVSNTILEISSKREFEISDLFSIGNVENISNINLVIILVCDRRKLEFKYGDRGFIFSLIEAGEIMQNLAILATEHDYKFCQLGGYDINRNNKVLGIDGVTSFITSASIMGR